MKESEDVMERLISLFREPDYDRWSAARALEPGENAEHAGQEEPLYFRQLLAYLREQRRRNQGAEAAFSRENSEAEELIGAGA
jgi:hypothetical protein